MLNVQELVNKKVSYEQKKVEISSYDYEEEKAIELAKYSAELDKKYNDKKNEDLTKVDHYIELLNELIEDAKTNAFDFAEQNAQTE